MVLNLLYNKNGKRQRRDNICRKNAGGILKGAAHRNLKDIAVRCTLFLSFNLILQIFGCAAPFLIKLSVLRIGSKIVGTH